MGPKQQIWSEDAEFILIHLVRARPILWDPTLDEYRRTDLKELCWEEIAQEMGVHFTSAAVKKRFTNMRDTFMDNLRRVKESMRRASGKGDEIYKPKWPLYDNLLFLQKSCAIVASTSNISTSKETFTAFQQLATATELQNPVLQFSATKLKNPVSQFSATKLQNPVSQFSATELQNPVSQFSATKLQLSSDILPSFYGDKTLKIYIPSEKEEILEQDITVFSNNSFSEESSSTDILSNKLSSAESQSPLTCSLPKRSAPKESMSIKDTSKESLFKKRGATKQLKTSATQEALELMKEMISQPTMISQSTMIPQGDTAEHFGSYVAGRLREMDLIQRRHCEETIMKTLNCPEKSST